MAEVDQYTDLLAGPLESAVIASNTDTEFTAALVNVIDDSYVYESVTFIGAVTAYTDGSYIVKLQESEDNVTWTDCIDDDMLPSGGTNPITELSNVRIGYIGKQQYVRPVVTSTTVTTGATISLQSVLGNPNHQPAPDQPEAA